MSDQRPGFDPDRYPDPDSVLGELKRDIRGTDAVDEIEYGRAVREADEAYERWRQRPSLWRRMLASLFGR